MVEGVELGAIEAAESAVDREEVPELEGDEEEVDAGDGDEEVRGLPFSRVSEVESFDALQSLHRS